MAEAVKLAAELKSSKINTENVEVGDDSGPPAIEAWSSEEKALLNELSELLPEALKAVPESTKLMCLRGRKYDPVRGADTVQNLEKLKQTLGLNEPPPQLATDIATGKITNPGAKDELGRSLIWLRLRFHKPKESGPQDMGRLIATVMLKACEDVETQRNGIVLVNDLTGVGIKNLSPPTIKFIAGEVLPNLPIRVHRIMIARPPWFFAKIVFPIISTFLSKKLRARLVLIPEEDGKLDGLFQYLPATAIPEEIGGSYPFNLESWVRSMTP